VLDAVEVLLDCVIYSLYCACYSIFFGGGRFFWSWCSNCQINCCHKKGVASKQPLL